MVDNSLNAFENKESLGLSVADLSKAFDCVHFNVILEQLNLYGVSEHTFKLIGSYLTNRKQYFSIGGNDSSVEKVTMGVPLIFRAPYFFSRQL